MGSKGFLLTIYVMFRIYELVNDVPSDRNEPDCQIIPAQYVFKGMKVEIRAPLIYLNVCISPSSFHVVNLHGLKNLAIIEDPRVFMDAA